MADSISTETVLADAEIAAQYLRALTDKGIAMSAAIALTSSYIQTLVLVRAGQQKPKEPWEKES